MGWLALILLACAVAWLPLQEVLLLVGGATCALLLLRWPWLIWLPLALLLPITSGLRLGRASVTDLLLAGAVALWFLDGARRRRLPLHGSPVVVAAGVYVAVLLVAALGAQEFGEAAAEVIKWAGIVAAAAGGARHADCTAGALGGGRAGCGWGCTGGLRTLPVCFSGRPRVLCHPGPLHARQRQLWPAQSLWRLFGDDAALGGQPGAVGVGGSSGAGRGWRSSALAWAVYYTAAAGIIAAGLLASWSRGAWLGAAVGVLVVLVLRSRTAALLTGVGLLLLLVAVLLGAFSPQAIPATHPGTRGGCARLSGAERRVAASR